MTNKYLEAAKAHFRSFGTQQMDVPEWGCVVYWKPLTTVERDELFASGSPDDVTIVIRKALDEQGKPMFSLADKMEMRRTVSMHVLTRLAAAMLAAPTLKEAEKNSEAIPG